MNYRGLFADIRSGSGILPDPEPIDPKRPNLDPDKVCKKLNNVFGRSALESFTTHWTLNIWDLMPKSQKIKSVLREYPFNFLFYSREIYIYI